MNPGLNVFVEHSQILPYRNYEKWVAKLTGSIPRMSKGGLEDGSVKPVVSARARVCAQHGSLDLTQVSSLLSFF
jgi:hypothetical protein